MTPSLRNAHRRIWFVLAILMPVIFIAAVYAIPKTQSDTSSRDYVDVLPVVHHSGHSDQFSVKVRSNEANTSQQLEVMMNTPLTAPECLVYLKCAENEKILVGKLGSKGNYHFDLGNTAIAKQCQVEFFNPFDNSIVEMISFK